MNNKNLAIILASSLIIIAAWVWFDYMTNEIPRSSFANKAEGVEPLNPELQVNILEELGISQPEPPAEE